MFTGIIKNIGRVQSVKKNAQDLRAVIQTGMDLSCTEIGASICCSGCCLTVVEKGADWFAVDVSAETLSKTTLGEWGEGAGVNLEPSLRVGDELGGHIVSGHVDGLAQIVSKTQEGESWRLTFAVPDAFKQYIAPKGSVAIDGVSLTVNEVQGAQFGVNIIPHTWEHTTIGSLQGGQSVNFEVDILARYVARMMQNS